jgi:hypothetical protein
MNGYLLPIPVVALTMTLAACSDGVMEHPPAGSPYSVEFTLWTGPPAYYTTPQGEPELFTFSAVTVGIPCEFDSGSSPYQGTPVTLGACTYDPPLSMGRLGAAVTATSRRDTFSLAAPTSISGETARQAVRPLNAISATAATRA